MRSAQCKGACDPDRVGTLAYGGRKDVEPVQFGARCFQGSVLAQEISLLRLRIVRRRRWSPSISFSPVPISSCRSLFAGAQRLLCALATLAFLEIKLMNSGSLDHHIRLAIAGVGNCAGSLLEGIAYHRERNQTQGLLFPVLAGYSVADIEVVAAFDVARDKVGRSLGEAIHQPPNNFVRNSGVTVRESTVVMRGPTLDGNPAHLARLVPESPRRPVDVEARLRDSHAHVLVNLLPTGSLEASAFYAQAAMAAGCAFVNCIPTVLAQRPEIQEMFSRKGVPLLGDDIKSQLGTTILHRTLLQMLRLRGARPIRSSQINVGGNTDFANFVYRAETKLASKHKSMATLIEDAESHVGHHYDLTRGPYKHAFIDIEAVVFGGSPVNLSVRLESDDKPNSAGSVVDLIRIAKAALDRRLGGVLHEACAFYMKSPPVEMAEFEALRRLEDIWVKPWSYDGMPRTASK